MKPILYSIISLSLLSFSFLTAAEQDKKANTKPAEASEKSEAKPKSKPTETQEEIKGEIRSVTQRTLRIQSEKETTTLHYNQKTEVWIDQKPADIKSLKVGDQVTTQVQYTAKGTPVATKIEMKGRTVKKQKEEKREQAQPKAGKQDSPSKSR